MVDQADGQVCFASALATSASWRARTRYGAHAALGRGPLDRDLFPAWYVGRNNPLKLGFRVCYAARQDS